MAEKLQRMRICLRVSNDDQHAENQLLQLRKFCERWEGHELTAEYVDRESGTGGRRERKDFDRMFSDAARRRFGVVLFWGAGGLPRLSAPPTTTASNPSSRYCSPRCRPRGAWPAGYRSTRRRDLGRWYAPGSLFFMPRTFVGHPAEKDKKARPGPGRNTDSHFRIRRQALNWDPRGLCKALALISASIHNVRSFALWKNGSDLASLRFAIPKEAHFRGPLGMFPGIGSSNMDGVVLRDAIQTIERGELEEALIRAFGELRGRWDPAARADANR